jgi:hypothetical protein
MNKEYRAYYDAIQRCTNSKHKRYADWGGRGISVKFKSFEDFYNHIGPSKPDETLDRIDNNGNYEYGNVRWCSRTIQQHNKRTSKHNQTGLTGVRVVKSKGVVSLIYQAFSTYKGKFYNLYCGPDFFLACCYRKSFENHISATAHPLGTRT